MTDKTREMEDVYRKTMHNKSVNLLHPRLARKQLLSMKERRDSFELPSILRTENDRQNDRVGGCVHKKIRTINQSILSTRY